MTEVFEEFSMDFTSRSQYAKRDDGVWFKRRQYRDPRYGYKWSKWEATSFGPKNAIGMTMRIRLPK